MLIPSVRIGINTQRKTTKLRAARTRTRMAVRRGWRPKTRRRVRLAPESGSVLECSMLNGCGVPCAQHASLSSAIGDGTSGLEHRRYQIHAGNAGLQIRAVPIRMLNYFAFRFEYAAYASASFETGI